MTPTITLWTPEQLKAIDLGGLQALVLPWGCYLVAIDGETQRIAWGMAYRLNPHLRDHRVGLILHHGKSVEDARQGFHDLNTKEVKPNAAIAISMDNLDPATKIAREVADNSEVLRDAVNMRRRQLRKSDRELVTLSGLRTAIVTTILGPRGLQAGAKSIVVPEGTNMDDVRDAVMDVWLPILEDLGESLAADNRAEMVTSAPAVLAGLGCLAHHAMPKPPRSYDESWSVEEVLERLEGIVWEREIEVAGNRVFPWEGVAGKLTPKGSFSIGGPKEVGYTVAKALEDPDSDEGKRIRNQVKPATGPRIVIPVRPPT
jgi:DNA sulfur modification protein DndB